jgi:hypothetical protein
MNRFFLAAALAMFATSAIANPVPVTNTTKAPYKPFKIYCNLAVTRPSEGENIACYNHDACYSDPQGRSRADCDAGYLRDMELAGFGATAWVKYMTLRSWGEISWNRCREHDKLQAQN